MRTRVLASVSLLSTGLLAGAFLYASLNVLPTLRDVTLEVHLAFRIALMRHNSAVMPSLMVLSIVTPWLFLLSAGKRSPSLYIAVFATSGCAVIALLTTIFGNVPINGIIRTWSAAAPPHDWQQTLRRWDTFHAIRVASALAGFVCAIVGAHLNSIQSR